MKKSSKLRGRIISMLLSLSIVAVSSPIPAFASSLDFNNGDDKTLITDSRFVVYKSTRPRLSIMDKLIEKKIKLIAKNDVNTTAKLINSTDDEFIYESYLKTALNEYYADLDSNKANIIKIKKVLDKKAEPIIKKYEAAAVERAKKDYLNYKTTSVIVSFDEDATDEYIESYLDDTAVGYKVLFDGTINPNENLPADKLADLKQRISKLEDNKFDKIYEVDLRLDQTTDSAIKEISDEVSVDTVNKNYLDNNASDPGVKNQYYLKTINVDDAYPMYDNAFAEQWIAVLDDGIDMNHEDLKANLLSNYCYDISQGKLLKNCTTKYTGPHGTQVSGVIAAVSNNGKGISGVASGNGDNYNKLMMIKVTDSNNSAYTSNFISGIEYAMENGASVINISYSGTNYNSNYQKKLIPQHH